MNNGEKAWTIDEVPLEWCVGNGVKVDMRDKPDGYRLMPEDFEEYFKKVGYELQPGDILLLNTGADKTLGYQRIPGSRLWCQQSSYLMDDR